MKHQPNDLTNVLRRSVELAVEIGTAWLLQFETQNWHDSKDSYGPKIG